MDVCGSVNGNHGCRPKDERTCSSDNRWGADAGGLAERCDVQIARRRRIHRNIAVVASRRVAPRAGVDRIASAIFVARTAAAGQVWNDCGNRRTRGKSGGGGDRARLGQRGDDGRTERGEG